MDNTVTRTADGTIVGAHDGIRYFRAPSRRDLRRVAEAEAVITVPMPRRRRVVRVRLHGPDTAASSNRRMGDAAP
jgi:hypothetical protein